MFEFLMSQYNFSMQTSLERKTTTTAFHTQIDFMLHHHYTEILLTCPPPSKGRDGEEELMSDIFFYCCESMPVTIGEDGIL